MTQPKGAAAVDIICPMPTAADGICGKDLHLLWQASRGLGLLDVTIPETIGPVDAWAQTWTVECEDGHVLLAPEDCRVCGSENEPDHECDNDEYRTFRPTDAARLAVVLGRLNVGNLAAGETHDDRTLDKVRAALARAGVTPHRATDVITYMQNEGILFRERLQPQR